ncbi:MAG: hypothetical protein AAFR81_14215 [Chloroflexota bacterium]
MDEFGFYNEKFYRTAAKDSKELARVIGNWTKNCALFCVEALFNPPKAVANFAARTAKVIADEKERDERR